mmetsp:Transcript_16602/g.40388  ORF Transcript_16602/g.40388 Transcript_16602/m.40388 type:complete len:202 (+) Transcript_16602:1358-1963(+)
MKTLAGILFAALNISIGIPLPICVISLACLDEARLDLSRDRTTDGGTMREANSSGDCAAGQPFAVTNLDISPKSNAVDLKSIGPKVTFSSLSSSVIYSLVKIILTLILLRNNSSMKNSRFVNVSPANWWLSIARSVDCSSSSSIMRSLISIANSFVNMSWFGFVISANKNERSPKRVSGDGTIPFPGGNQRTLSKQKHGFR